MTEILLVAFALLGLVPAPDPAEPLPVPVLPEYGLVIDRAEAARLGLFRYRDDFGALRFVRTAPGRLEARIASTVGGVMIERAVPLDSPSLGRVTQGLLLLRDRGATNVELLLTPTVPLDVQCLGPATDARARAGGACFGLLGLGAGLVTGTALTWDHGARGLGWPEWRVRNLRTTLAITAGTTLLGGLGGWLYGSHADAGRPVEPQPRCAVAGYDAAGYPVYEEQVRQTLSSNNTVFFTGGSIVVGAIAAVIAGNTVSSDWYDMSGWTDPNGVGGLGEPIFDLSIVAAAGFIGNTIGRDMDRRVALEKLRNRPRPEPVRPLGAALPPAIDE